MGIFLLLKFNLKINIIRYHLFYICIMKEKKFIKNDFDQSTFRVDGFSARIEKPWGWELLLTNPSEDLGYVSKILHVNEGGELSLQAHDEKIETQVLISGRCIRVAGDENGNLIEIEMLPCVGYTNRLGQRHTLKGITDCEVFESSLPETGTTWRLSDKYGRGHETEDIRRMERVGLVPSRAIKEITIESA